MKKPTFSPGRLFVLLVFSSFVNLFLLVQPIYLLQVFDRVMASGSADTLIMLTLLAVSLLLAYMFLEAFRKRYLIALGVKIDASVSQAMVKKEIENISFLRQSSATLNDVKAIKAFLGGSGATALMDAPWAIPFLMIIYSFHPQLGFLASVGVVLAMLVSLLGQIISRRHAQRVKALGRQAESHLQNVFTHREMAHGLGMRDAFLDRWHEHNLGLLREGARIDASLGITRAVAKGLRLIMQVLMIGLAADLVIEGGASGGILIASTILFGKFVAPVETLVMSLPQITEALKAFSRISALDLDEKGQAFFESPDDKGLIEINNIMVRAYDGSRLILKGVNLSLVTGESLALIGPSGAGKSTLARTIVGSLEAAGGHVSLNRVPLDQWPTARRFRLVGYMPQGGTLFEGSIAENISRLQSPDSEKVVAAAQMAGVDSLIRDLPDGYQTQLGPGGFPLSAGEQQRIALARAVYDAPQVVVLDEPNASVDAEGERALHHCLQALKEQNITVIIITHRPGILTGVDKVAVMRHGVIESVGGARHMLRALSVVSQSGTPVKQESKGGQADEIRSHAQG